MKKTLSILLALSLLTALLPFAQSEDIDDALVVAQDAGDEQYAVEAIADDLFLGDEPDEEALPEPSVEAPAARYARLTGDAPVFETAGSAEPMLTLPAGSCVLVVDAGAPMKVAFATDPGAVVGFMDASLAEALSQAETDAMTAELFAGSVMLYEDDLDRPLPWAAPVYPAAEAEEAPAETVESTESAESGETGTDEATVEADAIEAETADEPQADTEAQPEADVEAGDADALLPEAEETAEPELPDEETLAAMAELADTVETVETVIDSQLDSDALFAGYAGRILYKGSSRALKTNATTNAGAQLTGQNLAIYNALKPEILKIAAGSRSDTIIKVPVATVLGKKTFTNSEYLAMMTNGVYSWDINLVTQTLWLDCTYELYWLDRYSEYKISASWSKNPFTQSGSGYTVDGKYVTFCFPVLEEYRYNGNLYIVGTSLISGAKAAAENAKAIVKKYEAYSDYIKLFGYAKEICDLVDYNNAAASGQLAKTEQNPWKLIWVFDGNRNTNVVCEGYAQAFQYLCELTDFNDGIRCIMVTGDADGESHSWNVVRMDDGKNYLVDVTWMDNSRNLGSLSGSLAEWINEDRAGLLLCGASSGSASGGYGVNYRSGSSTTHRTYWDVTLKAYSSSMLSLAASKYVLTGFQRIGNDTYFFDDTGHYVTGTQQLNGMYMEFDDQGRLQGTPSGWQTVNGKRYFFEDGGLLHTHHTVVTDKAVSATCTTAGKTEGSHCSVCGTVFVAQKTVAAKGHTVVTDKAVAATYTATGKTEGSHCSVCGTVFVAQKAIPKLDCTFRMTKSATKTVNKGVPIQIVVPGKTIKTCSSSNKKVATVTKAGWVRTKKAGTAKITVTLTNKKKLKLTVKVVNPYVAKSVKITKGKKATMKKGATLDLTAVMTPSTARNTMTWTTSNKKVATVNKKTGLVTAKKKGKAKITVKTSNGKKATITITVK